MKNTISWVVIALIIIIGGWLLITPSSTPKEEGPIKIGAVLPLTGVASFYGEELKNGMELANQEAKLDLIIEDSKTDPKQGVSAFNKLLTIDKINTGIVAFSSIAGPVVPIAEEKKIPIIQTVVSAEKIGVDSPYSFRYFPSSEQEAQIITDFAVNNLKIKTAAVLYINGEYGLAYKNSFVKSFNSLGGNILLEETFQITDGDFRTQLAKIKAKTPDAVYVVGFGSHLVPIFKQIKEFKINSLILTNWVLASPTVQKSIGRNDEGVYFTSPAYYFEEKTQIALNFIDKYKKTYDKKPSAYAAIGFDTINLLKYAESGDIINQLRQVKDFSGVMGKLSTEKNNEITFPLYVVKIEDGKLVRVEQNEE